MSIAEHPGTPRRRRTLNQAENLVKLVGTIPIPTHAIVVGLDHSPESAAGVEWAAAEATSSHLPVHLIHAVQPPLRPDRTQRTGFDNTPAGCVTDACRALAESFPEVAVTWSQPYGTALPALTWASRYATFIVVGTRGRGAIRQVVTGSTAVELIADAHCPIVVMPSPQDTTTRDGPVVVGLEGREAERDALQAAFREARDRIRSVDVIHASEYEFFERARIERLVAAAQRWYPEVNAKVHIHQGNPADLLVTRSKRASVLVLGTRGHHEVAGAVLGSVSQHVLRHAACPVLVARNGTLRPPAQFDTDDARLESGDE